MKIFLLASLLMLIFSYASFAQKGTAEPDYYPSWYSGDTWSGKVTSVNEDTREFTLTYNNGKKEQTFTGVLTKGYLVKMKDGTEYELKMKDIMDKNIKAYYANRTVKDASGAKVKTIEVFKIKFITDK